MGRPGLRLAFALLLGAVGLFTLMTARPASASDEYRRALNQPCIACHTEGGVSADLNLRGQAFAAVADHKANSDAAWATAVQAYPLKPSSGDGASILVPIAVGALLVGWLYMMLRRRRTAA